LDTKEIRRGVRDLAIALEEEWKHLRSKTEFREVRRSTGIKSRSLSLRAFFRPTRA
jgi:hypothetical protein